MLLCVDLDFPPFIRLGMRLRVFDEGGAREVASPGQVRSATLLRYRSDSPLRHGSDEVFDLRHGCGT